MTFDKALNEALQITVLKGVYNPSNLKTIQSTMEKSSISVDTVDTPPAGAYSNLHREKVKLSDSLIREAEVPPAPEGGDEGIFDLKDDPTANPEGELEDQTTELPEDEFDAGGAGISSGSNYTVEMVKSQLDGILKMWMDLAGNYPEGDERHKFIEIGERLREISGVVERDFVQKHPD